ncbi:uncharacterized protein HMPREF1541_00361 [Cyphellophora europaea CBS 101466]|uniref:Uncharacterized protein n=1 Tax=Cyphellophora europaea (strain CBS 101466) TaxID=1220924 RepID=W2SBU2_CYPE1|nr:uncharacterized protein HMPREF1541_00361 [Cyphellophora europaea CBS 101466]ETN46177.1 hypothetical protein HMPREF1541_00361 [Cyphellophora europaea CBS 101466]
MPPFPPCPKMKPQIYGAMPEKPNPKMAYALAHSARCKLALSANRPDRNLRMVLGHAFALDNLLVRIVEIENESVANQFDNSKPDEDQPVIQSEIAQHDKQTAGIGGGAGVTVAETGSLAKPQPQSQGRRVSFGNSAQFRPSEYNGNGGSGSKRRKSPPPKKVIPKGYEDEESTSSDDYDDIDPADFVTPQRPQAAIRNNTKFEDVPKDPYEDEEEEEEGEEEEEEEEEDTSLGLTRFESASAQRPRPPPKKAPSPPPEDVPALEEDWSDGEAEDRPEPPSPPQFADDVLRTAMTEGEKDEELGNLYETLRGCPCCKQHGSAPKKSGVWKVQAEGGKQYAVLAEEQDGAQALEQPHEIAVGA